MAMNQIRNPLLRRVELGPGEAMSLRVSLSVWCWAKRTA